MGLCLSCHWRCSGLDRGEETGQIGSVETTVRRKGHRGDRLTICCFWFAAVSEECKGCPSSSLLIDTRVTCYLNTARGSFCILISTKHESFQFWCLHPITHSQNLEQLLR